MSHKPRLTRMAVDAQAEAIALLLRGGWCEIMAGDPPENPEGAPEFDAVLARAKLADVPFGKPQNGVMLANLPDRAIVTRGGEPRWVRFVSNTGQVVFDGTYGLKDSNAVGNVKTLVEGQFVDITGIKYVIPKTN